MSLLLLLSSPSAAAAPTAASGYFTFAGNPVDGDLMPDINGVSGTMFVASPIGGYPSIQIGATMVDTIQNLIDALSGVDPDAYPGLALANYASNGSNRLLITYKIPCPEGTDFTLGASTANITRSAETLSC